MIRCWGINLSAGLIGGAMLGAATGAFGVGALPTSLVGAAVGFAGAVIGSFLQRPYRRKLPTEQSPR
jgi:hypothetical protein